MSLEIFTVTGRNPNESTGGRGCLCMPEGGQSHCEPPYVVFHKSDTSSPGSPHSVASAACLKAAVDQCRQAVGSGDLPLLGENPDVAAISEPSEANTPWEDLTSAEQKSFLADFAPGSVVRLDAARVVVVGGGEVVPPAGDPDEGAEDDYAQLNALAAEAPQEVPGPEPGTFESADQPDEPDEDETPEPDEAGALS